MIIYSSLFSNMVGKFPQIRHALAFFFLLITVVTLIKIQWGFWNIIYYRSETLV